MNIKDGELNSLSLRWIALFNMTGIEQLQGLVLQATFE